MIPLRQVLDLRAEWQLRADVIEKDYVLGWLLAAIASTDQLAGTWVFKGGTCLRKCYFETYRFSEDLDFTVTGGGPETPDELLPIFRQISEWLFERAGIEVQVHESSFVRRRNLRGNPTTLGRLAFRGPTAPPTLPKVKLDITSDEALVGDPVVRNILHPYTDGPLPCEGISCYSITELLSEKLRALAQRCRPRDLYDVVNIYRHPDLVSRAPAVLASLDQKCAFVGIPVPDAQIIRSSPFREEIELEWANMLAHQLPHLPPFQDFWNELDELFAWLHDGQPTPVLPRAQFGNLDPGWGPPAGMVPWQTGAPLELIRFAGTNRLLVEIDYRAERGRWGPRVVEPYAFRRSREGNLLLFVVNDQGALRSYRVDRIAGVRVLDRSFRPSYLIEF